MGVPESVKAADQILLRIAVGQGPLGDRRDDSERVLNPMAQLRRQDFLLFLGGDKVRNIDKRQKHTID